MEIPSTYRCIFKHAHPNRQHTFKLLTRLKALRTVTIPTSQLHNIYDIDLASSVISYLWNACHNNSWASISHNACFTHFLFHWRFTDVKWWYLPWLVYVSFSCTQRMKKNYNNNNRKSNSQSIVNVNQMSWLEQ